MTPDDLAAVNGSWHVLRRLRDPLVTELADSFGAVGRADGAERRARWVVDAVAELVGLLAAPERARRAAHKLASTWPVDGAAPTFQVEGVAWMHAARAVPGMVGGTERAWLQAWLLLSDVIAEESLSPFATPPRELTS